MPAFHTHLPSRRALRLAGTAFLAVYGFAYLREPLAGGLIDGVDLAIHETGHLVFAPFGEFLHFAGGTLLQLLLPLAFVASFWRRHDPFAASVALWWTAQNCWHISVYAADARTQALPLVGGGEHDWAYLLGALGWLQHDVTVARAFTALGVLLWLTAIGFGAWTAWTTPVAPPDDAPADVRPGSREPIGRAAAQRETP